MICEWNPAENQEAYTTDKPHANAIWQIGTNTTWHLCDQCARLPRFRKYKKRDLLKNKKTIDDIIKKYCNQ
jgi:hypothetical protein